VSDNALTFFPIIPIGISLPSHVEFFPFYRSSLGEIAVVTAAVMQVTAVLETLRDSAVEVVR